NYQGVEQSVGQRKASSPPTSLAPDRPWLQRFRNLRFGAIQERSDGHEQSGGQYARQGSSSASESESIDQSLLVSAYSYPRVIHRSEESRAGFIPAASVNNSAAAKDLLCPTI